MEIEIGIEIVITYTVTRRVAVYLETHCNISLNRAFPARVLDRWHNCLLIYWCNVAQLPRPHRFVYFCVMSQQDGLPKIWVGAFLVRSVQSSGKTELILTVKMDTRHPVEGPFGREFPAIWNHCRVMTAWSCKTWKFCEQFLRILEKTIPLKLATAWIAPKICHCLPFPPPPHVAHTVP